MGFIAKFLPTKYLIGAVVIVFLALSGYCGYLYVTKQTIEAKMETVKVELAQAKKDIATQKETIDLMAKDAKTQAELMKQYQVNVDDIRKMAADKLLEIDNTDFGKEANSNASDLEKVLNDRMKQLFSTTTQLSRGK